MDKEYLYSPALRWTGNTGVGTEKYQSYERSYVVSAANKPDLYGSSDPAFRGDKSCWNPEELLVASISACHMLWYLHLCAEAHIVVSSYEDQPLGKMKIQQNGSGNFQEVMLRPCIVITDETQIKAALDLHEAAHKKCFIANSVNFPILIKPSIVAKSPEL